MAVRDPALLGGRGLDVNAVRVSWLFFKLGVLNELQYRVNFFVALLQSALALAVGLAVLALVYSQTDELNGWSQSELLCLLGVQILMGGLIKTYIQPNMTRLIEDVREGKLDFALTKPEDAQVLVSVREVRIWQVVDVVSGLIVLGVGISRITTEVGARRRAAFAVALLLGVVLIYCFWLVIATVAFWVVNMWHAVELFDGVFQTGRWPIGIYPGWLRYSVTFLVPIAFAVTVPAEALTSRLDWETLALAVGFAVRVLRLHALVLALRALALLGRLGVTDIAAQTWHYGLVARWWAEFNLDGPEIDFFRPVRRGRSACARCRRAAPVGCSCRTCTRGLDVDGSDISPDMLAASPRSEPSREGLEPPTPRCTARCTSSTFRAGTGTIFVCGGFGLGGTPRATTSRV